MPLAHPPGHAQADFGEALVDIGGVRMKAHFLVMDLPYCDACFVKAYSNIIEAKIPANADIVTISNV